MKDTITIIILVFISAVSAMFMVKGIRKWKNDKMDITEKNPEIMNESIEDHGGYSSWVVLSPTFTAVNLFVMFMILPRFKGFEGFGAALLFLPICGLFFIISTISSIMLLRCDSKAEKLAGLITLSCNACVAIYVYT